jgi:hypothetical protein
VRWSWLAKQMVAAHASIKVVARVGHDTNSGCTMAAYNTSSSA